MNAYVVDCLIVACHHNLVRYVLSPDVRSKKIIGCRLAALTFCPRTTQRMFTIKVRLEAGTLHFANYLIRVAVYILGTKVDKI